MRDTKFFTMEIRLLQSIEIKKKHNDFFALAKEIRIEKSVLATKSTKLQAITFQKTLFYTNRQLVTVTTKVVSKQARDHRTKLSMFFFPSNRYSTSFLLIG